MNVSTSKSHVITCYKIMNIISDWRRFEGRQKPEMSNYNQYTDPFVMDARIILLKV